MKRRDLITELKGLKATELVEKARTTAEEMMKLRFRKSTGQTEGINRISGLRKDLARIKTFIKARSLES